MLNDPMDFFEFLFTKFAASLKPSRIDIIIVKRLTKRRNNVTTVQIESTSCDQGRRKSDAFRFRPHC